MFSSPVSGSKHVGLQINTGTNSFSLLSWQVFYNTSGSCGVLVRFSLQLPEQPFSSQLLQKCLSLDARLRELWYYLDCFMWESTLADFVAGRWLLLSVLSRQRIWKKINETWTWFLANLSFWPQVPKFPENWNAERPIWKKGDNQQTPQIKQQKLNHLILPLQVAVERWPFLRCDYFTSFHRASWPRSVGKLRSQMLYS